MMDHVLEAGWFRFMRVEKQVIGVGVRLDFKNAEDCFFHIFFLNCFWKANHGGFQVR